MKSIKIEKNNILRVEHYKKDNETGEITKIFKSHQHQTIINELVNCLYDCLVKRNSGKSEQYYYNDNEYCYIKVMDKQEDYTYYYYIIGLSNQWGNYLDFTDTINKNNIKII